MSTDRDHLDAETVAAWIDGGLDGAALAAAEAHASNCERCQALLATVVKTEPLGTRHQAPGTTRIWRWWLAPIAATAAAVTLWMVVPQEQLQQKAATAPAAEIPAPTAGERERQDAAAPLAQARPSPTAGQEFGELKRKAESRPADGKLGAAQSNVARDVGAKPGAPATRTLRGGVEDARENKLKEERVARLEAEPAPARAAQAPAAQAPAAPAAPAELRDAFTQLRKQAAPLQFVSPNPQYRWRASADGIERSEDGGRTWLIVRLPQGEIVTAGASPAPLVCWVVGRRGLVMVATDGTNFTKIPFPEPVDLTAVSSPELRIAIVTTADGRTFRTENGGRNWRQQ